MEKPPVIAPIDVRHRSQPNAVSPGVMIFRDHLRLPRGLICIAQLPPNFLEVQMGDLLGVSQPGQPEVTPFRVVRPGRTDWLPTPAELPEAMRWQSLLLVEVEHVKAP